MKTGLLWYDASKKPTETKVQEARDFYAQKYGVIPNFCMVSPGTETGVIAEITICSAIFIMPNHFWIGVNGEKEKP